MSEKLKTEVRDTTVDSADMDAPCYGAIEDLMDRYSHCPLCGSHLHFTHLTDFSRNITQETATCPECGTKPRKSTHRLQ